MKTIGSAIVTLFLIIIGMSIALGVLLSNPNLFNSEQARQTALVANQKAQLEIASQNAQIVYNQQRQAQALENQRAWGAAFTEVIRYGGIALVYALSGSIVVIAIAYASQIIVDAMIGLRTSQATRPAGPPHTMPKPVALEPLRFPEPQQAQRMKKVS